jgi:hypothetical protein
LEEPRASNGSQDAKREARSVAAEVVDISYLSDDNVGFRRAVVIRDELSGRTEDRQIVGDLASVPLPPVSLFFAPAHRRSGGRRAEYPWTLLRREVVTSFKVWMFDAPFEACGTKVRGVPATRVNEECTHGQDRHQERSSTG